MHDKCHSYGSKTIFCPYLVVSDVCLSMFVCVEVWEDEALNAVRHSFGLSVHLPICPSVTKTVIWCRQFDEIVEFSCASYLYLCAWNKFMRQ